MNIHALSTRRIVLAAAIILNLCVFGFPSASLAGTRTWNGGATPDGNWTTPGNWNGIAPSTNDLLVFTGATQTATTNNFSAGNGICFIAKGFHHSAQGWPRTAAYPGSTIQTIPNAALPHRRAVACNLRSIQPLQG
jgi:hypothetical protein